VRDFIYCGRGMHGGKYGQGGLLEDGRNIGILFRYTNGRCVHMQLVKYITLLLLIPSLCWAVEPIDYARMNVGIVSAGGAAAGGPKEWYYGGAGGDDFDADSSEGANGSLCNNVVITTGGSITKLGIKVNEINTNAWKVAIYNTSNALLNAGCTRASASTAAGGGTWYDCDLGTPYSVASSTTLRICFNLSIGTILRKKTTGGTCYYAALAYASFPDDPTLAGACGGATTSLAIRAYVD
jgi:hypothetical protein